MPLPLVAEPSAVAAALEERPDALRIVDLRPRETWAAGHVPGAVPLGQFGDQLFEPTTPHLAVAIDKQGRSDLDHQKRAIVRRKTRGISGVFAE